MGKLCVTFWVFVHTYILRAVPIELTGFLVTPKGLITFEVKKYQNTNRGGVWTVGL